MSEIPASPDYSQLLAEVKELNVTLEDSLARHLIPFSAALIRFEIMDKLGLSRPPKGPKEDPRAWWKYLYAVVLIKIRDKKTTVDWNSLARRREDRLRYIELWKNKKRRAAAAR